MKKYTLIVVFLLSFIPFVSFANTVIYNSSGDKYEGYFKLKSKDAPTVFIIHDWDGLTEYETKRADMLRIGQSIAIFAVS